MGTAGARFVVSKQLRSSAGTWCYFQGKNILIDPGPGTLRSCFCGDQVLNPEVLDLVILSHRHLDHSTDINVIIEAMTHGTFNRRGILFAPSDAVDKYEPVVFSHVRDSVERLEILKESRSYAVDSLQFETPIRHDHPAETYGFKFKYEPVVFSHVRDSVERLEILKESRSYAVDSLQFETPIRHDHPAETYGFKFKLDRGIVSFVTDTKFSQALIDKYRGSDILVMNVLLKEPFPDREIKHLDLGGAQSLIEGIKPRLAIMTHFGLTMLKNDPNLLARKLSKMTGTEVVAATDGLTVNLEQVI